MDYWDTSALKTDTPDATHWASRAKAPELDLVRRVRRASIGAQPQEFGSSYWRFSVNFNDLRLLEAEHLKAEVSANSGLKPFLFYDRFRPYPLFYSSLEKTARDLSVREVTLKEASRENHTLTLAGVDGELLSVGDPMAYLLNGKRYYNKVEKSAKLTPAGVEVKVQKRPEVSESALDITLERVRPCAAFSIDMQSYTPPRGGKLKRATLSGIEWTGASS